jgi:hypothetical protein
MSFAPFESINDNLNNFNPNKMNKKVRFSNDEKKDLIHETPGFWGYGEMSNVIDTESNLMKSDVGSRQKTKMEMVGELHPNNYSIPVGNSVPSKKDEKFYYPSYYTGPGAGFGNLSVSSSIRVGNSTRLEKKNDKPDRETKEIDRWEFIDDRYSSAQNLVMEMPRGGSSTRKLQNDLSNITRQDQNREFEFKY